MSRDYQQSLVYSAETLFMGMLGRGGAVQIAGTSVTVPPEARFGDVAAVQRYVNAALAHPAVVAEFGDQGTVTVRVRKGTKKAHYEYATQTIAVPETTTFLREYVVLHELGHHFAPESRHGPAFTATVLRLLELIVGPEAAFVLGVLYRESGVEVG
ncbi:TIGR04338 family metallohydrolase [Gordonia aichiensis]|uniref:TIGR04338 family metallohydrolase n=1 Tax=Gordonia aichiensis TaxID=36820 RepID=UPI0032658243